MRKNKNRFNCLGEPKQNPGFMREISEFAEKLSIGSGIGELMQDLGQGLEDARRTGKEISMLGGGNPAHIPEMDEIFLKRWQDLGNDPETIASLLGDYSSPQGSDEFREILAESLSTKLNYKLTKDHIAITQGSQTAFFLLFNSFSGKMAGSGNFKKILLPLVPEYIGYTDQGIHQGIFESIPPLVQELEGNRFRYLPDLGRIEESILSKEFGAVCLSRPTNPSGNVMDSIDVEKIYQLCLSQDISLLVDNAYGYPFPNILFSDSDSSWKPGMIHILSLSKLGLPGTRTGIVVADPKIASLIGEMSAVLNLAGGNLGSAMVMDWVKSGEIYRISNDIIKPFYAEQSRIAQALIDDSWKQSLDYRIHQNLGALFLWIRFPNHKKDSRKIYEEAKKKGVFVIAGDNFFPGLKENFSHQKECIRLTYSRNLSELNRGIEILTRILS